MKGNLKIRLDCVGRVVGNEVERRCRKEVVLHKPKL